MLKKYFHSFKKGWKGDFFKSNKFIFVLKLFLLRIKEMKLKNDFLNLNKTFFWVFNQIFGDRIGKKSEYKK